MKSLENAIKVINDARRSEKKSVGWQWSGIYDGKHIIIHGNGTYARFAVIARPGMKKVSDESPRNMSVKQFKQWVSDFVSREPQQSKS